MCVQAIINGLRESVKDFNDSVQDIGSREVMEMMLITQYFDTLRDLGAHGKGSTVFVPHNVSCPFLHVATSVRCRIILPSSSCDQLLCIWYPSVGRGQADVDALKLSLYQHVDSTDDRP
jgi:hypothetical protein